MTKNVPMQTLCFVCEEKPGRLLESDGEAVCRKCAQRAIDEMVAEKKARKS